MFGSTTKSPFEQKRTQLKEKKKGTGYKNAIQSQAKKFNQAPKTPEDERMSYNEEIGKLAQQQKERDLIARQEGTNLATEKREKDYPGLPAAHRSALQESANSQIARDINGYEKRLLGQQGMRGIKGGTAFAQRQELARIGTEAQQQMQRDLSSLDYDTALRNQANEYLLEQGEIGQEGLRRQQAKEELESYNQSKYQKRLAQQANRLFTQIGR